MYKPINKDECRELLVKYFIGRDLSKIDELPPFEQEKRLCDFQERHNISYPLKSKKQAERALNAKFSKKPARQLYAIYFRISKQNGKTYIPPEDRVTPEEAHEYVKKVLAMLEKTENI